MALNKEKKKEVIDTFKLHAKDNGSVEVQVAMLTERINALSEHFKLHRRDFGSRRGLLQIVGQRRRLLNYLKKTSPKKYEEILSKLNLRK